MTGEWVLASVNSTMNSIQLQHPNDDDDEPKQCKNPSPLIRSSAPLVMIRYLS